MADLKKKSSPKNSKESFEQILTKTIRAIAEDDHIEVSFGHHQARVSGQCVFLPKPQADIFINKDKRQKISVMRGEADGQALRFVHHNIKTNLAFTPPEAGAKELFDIAEQARCEAKGAKDMKGIAHNLDQAWRDRLNDLKAPDRADAPIPAKAFGAFIWENLSKRTIKDNPLLPIWRKSLTKQMGHAIDKLLTSMDSQEAFARQICALLSDMGLTDAQPDESKSEDNQDDSTQDDLDENEQGYDESADSAQMDIEEQGDDEDVEGEMDDKGQMAQDDEDASHQQDSPQSEVINANAGLSLDKPIYHIYTKDFDQIIMAEDYLSNPDEMHNLRQSLDRQLVHLQPIVASLANRLHRHLMARYKRDWEFDLEEGQLDPQRLSRIITNPSVPLAYRQERLSESQDTVISLLLDNSGSMRGRPIMVAALCADIFARTLERCGVKVEILGFTTKKWKGGQSREKWLRDNRPFNPGRLNDILHIIYKSASQTWRKSHRNLGLMMKEGLLRENIDGEALLWAHHRLLARPEERRILMVISDGAPVDDSTLSSNSANYLEKHLRNVIEEIENFSPVELLAIGIGHDVTRYYKRAVTILDVEELGEVMTNEFVDLFDRSKTILSRNKRAHIKARTRFDATKPLARKADMG